MSTTAAAHFDLVERAQAGKLTGPERAALVALLDRVRLADLTDEEAEAGRTPPWWRHAAEAYQALARVEADPCPPPRAGGADVHRLRAR